MEASRSLLELRTKDGVRDVIGFLGATERQLRKKPIPHYLGDKASGMTLFDLIRAAYAPITEKELDQIHTALLELSRSLGIKEAPDAGADGAQRWLEWFRVHQDRLGERLGKLEKPIVATLRESEDG